MELGYLNTNKWMEHKKQNLAKYFEKNHHLIFAIKLSMPLWLPLRTQLFWRGQKWDKDFLKMWLQMVYEIPELSASHPH